MKKINKNKLTKILVILNIIFFVIAISFIISMIVISEIYPFPERFFVSDLTHTMIKAGEAIYLIMIYLTTTLSILCFIGSLICSILITKNIFMTKEFFELYEKSPIKQKWLIILIFFYNFLAIVLIFSVLYFLVKFWNNEKNQSNEKINFLMYSKYKQLTKKILISSCCLVVIIPTFTIAIFAIKKKINIDSTIYNFDKSQNMYTLSENKPNTMILYFDRGLGLLFNFCFIIDYLLFKEDSFIVKYPEFTSYVNVLSNATNTIASNPTINGSWDYLPYLKNSNLINPILKKPNCELTMNEWFLYSYSNMVKLFKFYGYENYALIDPPYYGNLTNGYFYSNSSEFEHDLNNYVNVDNKPINISVIDIASLSKSIGKKINLSESDEPIILQNFGAHETESAKENQIIGGINYGLNKPFIFNKKEKRPLNISVSNKKGSSLIFHHFFTTHQPYSYIIDKNISLVNNPYQINYINPSIGEPSILEEGKDHILISIWYAVQKLKNIMNYMKNLPYNGPHSDLIKNQYDNTNIYVIADHGYGINFNYGSYLKILNYLYKNKFIDEKQLKFLVRSNERLDNLDYQDNPVFLVKQSKYINKSWNKEIKENKLENFFNVNRLLSLSDLTPIIDANLQKVQVDRNLINIQSKFIFDVRKSWFSHKKNYVNKNYEQEKIIKTLVEDNLVFNPLEVDLVKTNSRSFPIVAVEWRFKPYDKKFKIYLNKYFKMENLLDRNIVFNKNNYHDIKIN